MTQDRRTLAIALSGVFLAVAASTAHAQTSEACKLFTVKSDGSEYAIDYLDLGEPGHSPGDMRFGYRPFVDEAGDPAGYIRWVYFAFDGPPGSGERSETMSNGVMVRDDGQIFFHLLAEASRPSGDTDRRTIKDFEGVIAGGTGAYRLARGNVDVAFDENKATYTFNIRCD